MNERPSWDDRKALHDVWQQHARVDPGIEWGDFSRALIAVANWGYRRRIEEEEKQ